MNKKVLDKLPERAHSYIKTAWKLVYVYGTAERDDVRNRVDGIILGVYYAALASDFPEDFTGDDCQEIRDYYSKWFSL